MIALPALLLLGCPAQEVETVVAPPVAQPTPSPVPPAAPVATEASGIPRGDGPAYGDKWLIILSSSREVGVRPESVDVLVTGEVPYELCTLDSGEFKGLMPCYEVVVANAFADRGQALDYSTALTDLGVDNYAKNAGAYVGPQARVTAFCEGTRAETTQACGPSLRYAESIGDRVYAHLALDSVVSERLLATAPSPSALDEGGTRWRAPLSAEDVGSHSVGDRVQVLGRSSRASECRIAAFVALTRGTPHFGWAEYGDRSSPGCGSPEVFAELDCSVAGARWMLPQGVALPVHLLAWEAPSEGPVEVVTATPQYAQLTEDARTWAAGQTLEIHSAVAGWRHGARRVATVHTTWTTGDDYRCGGTDVRVDALALVDLSGEEPRILVPLHEIDADHQLEVLDVDSDGALELVERVWPETVRLIGEGGHTLCEISADYCDCPC